MSTNKILVVYHKADFDGICSGEIAKRFFGRTADYLGWDYGDPMPNLDERQIVFMSDISFKPDIMSKYKEKIIWIDHHKTAIESIDSTISGVRIEGVAACRLTWQYFFGVRKRFPTNKEFTYDYNRHTDCVLSTSDFILEEPRGVRLLGEYDVWDKHNPNADIYQVGLGSINKIDWKMVFDDDNSYYNEILQRGSAVWDYLAVVNRQVATERGFDASFEGLLFRVLNTARSSSLTFKDSIKDHHDGCMSYYWNGKEFRFSLYSVDHKKDIDLSVIAKKYGGGGHPGACGFAMSQVPSFLGGSSTQK